MPTAVTEQPKQEIAEQDNGAKALAAPRREIATVIDSGPLADLKDTARFEHMQRIAYAMAASSLLPDHLVTIGPKNNKQQLGQETIRANCFRIVNQAFRWQIDPFAMIDETYVVGGKLGYQGKLVAAIVNARSGLKDRLRYEFNGQTGDGLQVTVIGTFRGEDEPRTVDLSVGQAKTDNKMWRTDPEQKLIYSAVTKWARRHCPEIMLGVLTDDDIERISRPPSVAVSSVVDLIDHRPKSDQLADELDTRLSVEPVVKCRVCHLAIYDDAAKTGYCADHEPQADASDAGPTQPEQVVAPEAEATEGKPEAAGDVSELGPVDHNGRYRVLVGRYRELVVLIDSKRKRSTLLEAKQEVFAARDYVSPEEFAALETMIEQKLAAVK